MDNKYLPGDSPNYDYLIIDIETDPIPATQIYCAVVKTYDGKETWKFRPSDLGALKDFIDEKNKNPKTVWVGHNVLGFDAPTLNRLLGTNIDLRSCCVDTMVLSYLFKPNFKGGHSLNAWGKRLKFEKIDFSDFSSGFSEEMLTYCERDVDVTLMLLRRLSSYMVETGWTNKSSFIEHQMMRIIDTVQKKGVSFDVDLANKTLNELLEKQEELGKNIRSVFPDRLVEVKTFDFKVKKDGTVYKSYETHVAKYPKIVFSKDRKTYTVYAWERFNINSHDQCRQRLTALGWTSKEKTPTGLPKITEESLDEFVEKHGYPEAAFIKQYQLYQNRISTITSWLKNYNPKTGRIHPTIFSCGAITRRMRHAQPNSANITTLEKPYGKEQRAMWIPSKGRLMLGADAKGLEGNTLMHRLQNPEAVEYFQSVDIHTANQKAIMEAIPGLEITRSQAKTPYYAILYGASNRKIAEDLSIKHNQGKIVRDIIVSNVPGLKDLITNLEKEYQKNGKRIKLIDGGLVWPPGSHQLLNYGCQGDGAVLMKSSRIFIDKHADPSQYQQLLDVHDEWQFEIEEDYVEEFSEIIHASGKYAAENLDFSMEMVFDISTGKNWSETH